MARRVAPLASRGMAAGLDRDPLDQLDDRTAQLAVGQGRIGLQQAKRVRMRDQRERRVDALRGDLFDIVATLEERVDRNVEDPGYLRQTACADPVRSFFVLLNLLKRHADGLAQFGL